MENHSTQLIVVECRNCGKFFVPPKYTCPECGGADLVDTAIDGEGKIHTHTTVHAAPLGFEDQVPYDVALIEMPQVILTGRIVNPGGKELKIGDRVSFVNRDHGIYWFKLLD